MTTDNKTLADAHPGGRVRLGDELPPLPIRQRFTTLHGETYAYSAEQMQDYARAALSAHPSPGGQGDALLESLVARWRNHAEEIGVSDNLLCQKIANCTMRHAAELQAVLAARQPVGEPVIDYEDLVDQAKDLIQCGCSVNGAFDWLLEQLTDGEVLASPAQAVDLGAMPDGWRLSKKATCYQLSHGNDIIGNLVGPDAEENAGIIARVLDSQAVGNG